MIKLLLVDDHVLFLEALSSLISQQSDFTVIGLAGSVAQAVALARCELPDMVLMDFYLPDGTGLEATEAILAENPNTKIVFLTAHEEDDRLFEAIRYGAQGYMLKTTPAKALLAALRGLERGEAAINRVVTSRILQEFSQLSTRPEPEPDDLSVLTARERQVLEELRQGATNRQIAARLVISEQTVKNHVSHILAKLNLKNRYDVMR
jgi:DNA-binding NarL/FixJ family response regulator